MGRAQVVGHDLEHRGGADRARVQDLAAQDLQDRQDSLKAGPLAAGEDGNIAGGRAMAAARDRALHGKCSFGFHEWCEALDLRLVGGAHFHPNLARRESGNDAVCRFKDVRRGSGGGQAGDDDVDLFGHFLR